MPIYDIAAKTTSFEDRREKLRGSRAQRRYIDELARQAAGVNTIREQNIGYYEQAGTSEAEISAEESKRDDQIRRMEQRRLAVNSAREQTDDIVSSTIERGNEYLAAGGELTDEQQYEFYRNVIQATEPLVQTVDAIRADASANREDVSQYPDARKIQEAYFNNARWSLLAGRQDAIADAKEAAGDDVGLAEARKELFTTEQRGAAPELADSAHKINLTVDNMVDLMIEMGLSGQDMRILFSDPANLASYTQRAKSGLEAVGGFIGDMFGPNDQLLSEGGPPDIRNPNTMKRLEEAAPSTAAAIRAIEVPESLKGTPQAAEYQSNVITLAWLLAKLAEPNNPRLSNQDFDIALTQASGFLTDPTSVVRVLGKRLTDAEEALTHKREQFHRLADTRDANAMTPEEVDRLVFGMNVTEMEGAFEQTRTKIQDLMTRDPVEAPMEALLEKFHGDEATAKRFWDGLTPAQREEFRYLGVTE